MAISRVLGSGAVARRVDIEFVGDRLAGARLAQAYSVLAPERRRVTGNEGSDDERHGHADERAGRVAAIYARVSSERQRQEQTIQSQTVALRELAEQRGLIVPEEFIFEDDGFSGASCSARRWSGFATARSRDASRWCCVMRRTGSRDATHTRCCCSKSSRAAGSRSCSPRSQSVRARRRTSCCASSRG